MKKSIKYSDNELQTVRDTLIEQMQNRVSLKMLEDFFHCSIKDSNAYTEYEYLAGISEIQKRMLALFVRDNGDHYSLFEIKKIFHLRSIDDSSFDTLCKKQPFKTAVTLSLQDADKFIRGYYLKKKKDADIGLKVWEDLKKAAFPEFVAIEDEKLQEEIRYMGSFKYPRLTLPNKDVIDTPSIRVDICEMFVTLTGRTFYREDLDALFDSAHVYYFDRKSRHWSPASRYEIEKQACYDVVVGYLKAHPECTYDFMAQVLNSDYEAVKNIARNGGLTRDAGKYKDTTNIERDWKNLKERKQKRIEDVMKFDDGTSEKENGFDDIEREPYERH